MGKNIATFEEFCKNGVSPLVKNHYSGSTTKAEDLSDPKDSTEKGNGKAEHTEKVKAADLGEPKNANLDKTRVNENAGSNSLEDMEKYLSSVSYKDIPNIASKYGLSDKKKQTFEDISKKIDLGVSAEIVKKSLDKYPGYAPLIFIGSFNGKYKGPNGEKLSDNVELVKCSTGDASMNISKVYYVITEGGLTYIFVSQTSKQFGM